MFMVRAAGEADGTEREGSAGLQARFPRGTPAQGLTQGAVGPRAKGPMRRRRRYSGDGRFPNWQPVIPDIKTIASIKAIILDLFMFHQSFF
jgi:hypothetical protein